MSDVLIVVGIVVLCSIGPVLMVVGACGLLSLAWKEASDES